MSVSKVLVAITPSHREFPDGAQWSFPDADIFHIPAELSFFSRMGLCSLDPLNLIMTDSRTHH